jgi:RND family efflux transporter MFP subunit
VFSPPAANPAILVVGAAMADQVHDLSKLRIQRDVPPSPLRRALVRNLVLALIAAGVVLGGAVALRRGGAPLVQVVTVHTPDGAGAAGGAATAVTANGYVVARTRASVSAKVPGRLGYLGVAEGSAVRAGQVIARLENADYVAAVQQAEANLAAARATLIEAEADRDQVQREARRAREVRAQNPNLVSAQELELAESRATQAVARARAADARVAVADAGLKLAQANLENTFVRAPFSGTVLRKEAEVGEVVAPSVGGGLTRGAVVTMADLATLEVEVDVNEAYIARVTRGMDARITLDAYPDTAFRGAVRQVVPTADRQRATVQVKVAIRDRDPRILPEMGARVDFLERPGDEASVRVPPTITVPAAAVRSEEGTSVVWLVREGRLTRREVVAGPVSGGARQIRSGLAGGEVLLIGGLDQPREGQRVKVAPPSP